MEISTAAVTIKFHHQECHAVILFMEQDQASEN